MNQVDASEEVFRARAPWEMTGEAFVLMLKMPEEMLDNTCFVPDSLKGCRVRSASTIMYVHYKVSPVGPYKELLFMPGKYRFGRKVCSTISKIYVSTEESVVNGMENWAIPKTLAQFETRTLPDGQERVVVSTDGLAFADLTFNATTFGFPYSDRWLPERFRLMAQVWEGRHYIYAPRTKATFRWGHLQKSRIDPNHFPDITRGKSLRCVRLDPFRMHIPAASIVPEP